ncbi:MAG: cellulase family glycosylhydrolase [Elusimicrobia bacterium]|nr:cellulase family glycosylhydrolase [Elusimicrobiota bacterium]
MIAASMARRALLAASLAGLSLTARAFDDGLGIPLPDKPRLTAPSAPMPSAPFVAGVNYPWLNYGWDFGRNAWGHRGMSAPESRAKVSADFAFLKSKGVKVVRVFLLCDGRASPEFDERGRVTGFDDMFYPDVDALLAVARENDLRLVLVILNFELLNKAAWSGGVQLGGRAAVVADPAVAESFFQNALGPLLDRYGGDPAILAWEVMNEPEMRTGRQGIVIRSYKAVEPASMQAFAGRVAAEVHARTGHLVTLGSLGRSNVRTWKDVGLDFYQYHYYDYQEPSQPLDVRYRDLGLDKPCVLGEFPTKRSLRGIETYLDTMRDNGFSGAWAWSLRASDAYSGFEGVADRFHGWVKSH